MKLAIHQSKWGFSQDWISYCEENGIPYKIVNCYDSDIIAQIADCQALMWHHHHTSTKDKVFAQQLLNAVEQSGKKVFPNFHTGWHFDDKLGQKYLLEAIDAPLVPSYAFYDKKSALNWISKTTFPKVFKLRGGAGSSNVKLVKNKRQAIKLVKIAFGQGFSTYDKWGDIKERFRKYKLGKAKFESVIRSFRRVIVSTEFAKIHGREKGYVLFQEFIPNNTHDIRVVTIGNKAFALKRLVRDGDFRASGSGSIIYDKTEINEECVKIAFDISKRLKAQSVAYDFVFDEKQNPLIVEISYGYARKANYPNPGFWDQDLVWHNESFNPAHWTVDLLLNN